MATKSLAEDLQPAPRLLPSLSAPTATKAGGGAHPGLPGGPSWEEGRPRAAGWPSTEGLSLESLRLSRGRGPACRGPKTRSRPCRAVGSACGRKTLLSTEWGWATRDACWSPRAGGGPRVASLPQGRSPREAQGSRVAGRRAVAGEPGSRLGARGGLAGGGGTTRAEGISAGTRTRGKALGTPSGGRFWSASKLENRGWEFLEPVLLSGRCFPGSRQGPKRRGRFCKAAVSQLLLKMPLCAQNVTPSTFRFLVQNTQLCGSTKLGPLDQKGAPPPVQWVAPVNLLGRCAANVCLWRQ